MSVSNDEWAAVKLFVTDVDGVLTDGAVLYGPEGELAKRFFIRDGMGLRLLEAAGVRVGVITSEDSAVVGSRIKRLMLSAYKPGMKRKGDALRELMQQFGAGRAETVYMGDDVNDAEALQAAGIPCAPADATAFAHQHARYVTHKQAGAGAVREIADLILQAKGLNPDELWRDIHKQAESHDAGTV
jgi:3-deoxy-D-manno-octulosonate 8-phosphate phosphatase (KDO 8-P phosphatase)